MHPLFWLFFILSGGWFFARAAMAGKKTSAQVGLGVAGIVEFVVLMMIFHVLLSGQDFFVRALRAGSDMGPIFIYMVLPSLIIVFLTGLLLKRRPSQPAEHETDNS
jgi:hypothetical protein